MRFSWPRIAAWIVGLVVGAVYGVACTIAQAYTVTVFSLEGFPLGLILAIVGTAGLLVAVRLLTDDRWAALATGVGLVVATLVFSGKGPGGSVIVPTVADGQFNPGIVWTVAVALLVVVTVVWPGLTRVRSMRAK